MAKTIQLKIRNIIQETTDTVTLQFDVPTPDFAYRAGQSITLIFNDLAAQPFRRSYSFSSTPKIDKFPAITVKRQTNGRASTYLTRTVQVGDSLTALSPAGQFVLESKPKTSRDVILVGGGSGITPLFSLLKQTLTEEQKSRVLLVLANRNAANTIFNKKLENWAERFPKQLKIIHLWSNPLNTVSNFSNIEILQSRFSNYLFEDLIKRELQFAKKDAQLFICGPEGLALKAQMILKFMKFPQRQVHREIFIIKKPFRPDSTRFVDSEVSIKFQDETHQVHVPAGQTILAAAEANNINLPYSCLSGICTTCAGTCTSGKVEMYTQEGHTDSETGVGMVLTCVSYPVTEKVEMQIP
ncbi:MAG: 2Fe-2S iron-sulfur cluster-binding protein [Saprospiraceae bacterium]